MSKSEVKLLTSKDESCSEVSSTTEEVKRSAGGFHVSVLFAEMHVGNLIRRLFEFLGT